jgi:hypothetical protein
VSGVVQYNGSPLTGGKVVFISVDRHRSAAGQIQSDGSYSLATLKPGDGATPGQYRVTIVTDLEIRGKPAHVTCTSPPERLLTVEAGKENQFSMNVSRAEGWKLALDE